MIPESAPKPPHRSRISPTLLLLLLLIGDQFWGCFQLSEEGVNGVDPGRAALTPPGHAVAALFIGRVCLQ